MEPKRYQLFIDGKQHGSRGLDLACNPFNGNVVGDVVLVLESALSQSFEVEEDTAKVFQSLPCIGEEAF